MLEGVLVAGLLAAAPQLDPTTMIGISLSPSWPRPWGLAWHSDVNVDRDWKSQRNRAFREFASEDLHQCLGLFIDTDDDTADDLARLAKDPTPANTAAATSAAWRVWSSFGIDEAIRELATTGERGASMQRVLDACHEVRHALMTRGLPHVFVGATAAPTLPGLDQLLSRDRPVTLKLNNVAASQLIDALAAAAGVVFQTVGAGDTCHMSVEFEETPLRAALEQIAAQTPVRFELVDPRTLRILFPAPLSNKEMSASDKSFTLPTILTRVEPSYPQDAFMAAASGRVMLHFIVRDDGTVGDIHGEQKDDLFPSFIDAAADAARQWTYRPATKNGRPVSIEYTARFDFSGEGIIPHEQLSRWLNEHPTAHGVRAPN